VVRAWLQQVVGANCGTVNIVIPRVIWPAALSVSLTVGACGGSAIDDAGAGASGGAGVLGECNPLDDACSDGTYCQLWEGRTQCIEEGSTERDELCEVTETCQRGSICLGAGEFSGKLCQEPCTLDEDPWTVCDIGRHTCFVAVDDEGNDLPFGVCRY
jgi:hypothetical protein